MFETALGFGAGFLLGTLATFLLWMRSEDRDLRQGHIEIAGTLYQLRPMEERNVTQGKEAQHV